MSVSFVIDASLPADINTITLSYTFFEVGGKTPPAPDTAKAATQIVVPGKQVGA